MAHIEATTTDPSRKTENKMGGYPAKARFTNGKAKNKYRYGRWTTQEHQMFLAGLKVHGRNWKKISSSLTTRSSVQIRTHAQKYFIKQTRGASKDTENGRRIQISGTKKKRKRTTIDFWNAKAKTITRAAKACTFADGNNSDDDYKVFDKVMPTPRTTNMKIYPPAPQQPNSFQEMTKDDAKYARSPRQPLQTSPTKSKTLQTDFRIPTLVELGFRRDDLLIDPVDFTINDMFHNDTLL
uniref:HTH myb-type domain-containing protein n=1 Tax=Aplanochytrium stocchinoi TaxID=215587 RepID=A0A7S3PJT3_9STRA